MTSAREIRRDAARLWRLSFSAGTPDPARIRQITEQMIRSPHHRRLAVLADYVRRLRRDAATRTATVDSATLLDAGARTAIEAGLTRRYGRAMETTFRIDPDLIGGIRLIAASDMLDDSVAGRLAALERPFDWAQGRSA
jgi:F-type H+-transporting ATPase subunit delta